MNKNKKHGFTLIELLAVIVILSVIALITTPLILNVINDAKKGAAVDSAYEYLKAVEYSSSISQITSNSGLSDGIYKVSDLADKVNVKGTKPTYGTITIEKGAAINASLCINGYIVSYDGHKAESLSNCTETEDTTGPDIIIGTVKGTTSSLTINFIVNDNETGIESTKCFYSTDKSYNLEGKIENNTCKLTNLNDNTLYNYKIEAINNGGIKSEVTGSATTGNFESIEIEINPSDWSSSKKVTIKGSTSGATLEYKIVNGTTVKQDWTTYTGKITIDWASNVNTPTYIYARLNDGVNISETSNFTITKIDVTAPTLNVSNASITTNSITIPISTSDSESGIESTKCLYSTDESYNLEGKIENNTCKLTNLKNNTTYYYKVETTNKAGLKTTKTGSGTTGSFEGIEIEASPSDWSSSKKVTIKGSTSGATLEYKIVNGTTVKQDWTTYTGKITIDWASNVNTPTYIYARLNDGVNISETSNFTITKIDITAPTEASLSATTYTDQVMLNATCTDLESGISKYEFSKDNGTTWVSNGTNSTYVFKDLNLETNYTFKLRCTNNVSLSKEGSITKTTNTIIEPTLSTTAGSASSKNVTIKFNGTNILNPNYYVKGTVSSISSINVTESCGTGTNPGTCVQITGTTSLAANTWYKVSSDVVLTITENGSFYAATKDSKNLKAGATLTITSITKPASDIYYNNSTYTNGDITVQEAIEELYKKLS